MSLNCSGLTTSLSSVHLTIYVSEQHRLLKLAIPWLELAEFIMPDLKASTSKLSWWLGRHMTLIKQE